MYNFEKVKYIPGWMDEDGGDALYRYAMKSPVPNILEIGSFCGRSSCVIAEAVKDKESGVLICLDRFQSNVSFKFNYQDSKENPKTIQYTLNSLWNNLRRLELDQYVITVKGDHEDLLDSTSGLFGFIYVDGGHTIKRALQDCLFAWSKLASGGYLAVHDYGHFKLPDVKKVVDALLSVWGTEIHEQIGSTIVIKKE